MSDASASRGSTSPRKGGSNLGPSSIAGPSKIASSFSRRPSRSPAPLSSSYAPTAFTPLPRSLFAGSNIDISRSPSPPPSVNVMDATELSSRERRGGESGSSTIVAGGDIFIDELPVREPTPLPDTIHESAAHFDPPGLFTTSIMPSVKPSAGPESSVQVELQKPVVAAAAVQQDKKGKVKAVDDAVGAGPGAAVAEGGLLLPSHVLVDTASPMKHKHETDGEDGSPGDGDDPMEGVHFVDDDISKGSKRYFDMEDDEPKEVEATFLATADQSKICQNCKRPGHRSKDCKHIICTTCGAEDDHERRDCPVGLVCFGCGGRGHRKQDCPDPASRMSRRTGCDRCGRRDHMENTCHTIWRVYAYRSHDGRTDVQREKMGADGWEKEAIGGKASDEWCYNCAREGHLGDDCSKRRGSLARLTVPSAFSYAMSTRGPFAFSRSSRNADLPPPTHSRFDDDDDHDDYDDLPFITGGYKNFAGANAGKKGREKEKERMRARERDRAALGESDDEPSWFDGPRNNGGRGSLNIKGRGRGGGGGGFSTPNHGSSGRDRSRDRDRNGRSGGRRPWDSEYRERTPRGHRDRSRSPRPSSSSSRRGDRDDRDRDRNSQSQSKSDRRRNAQVNGKMPFSHNDLMSPSVSASGASNSNAPNSAPAKVISFGKLSMPGSGGDNDTPTNRGQGKGAKSLLNRALGNAMNNAAGNSTPSKGGKGNSKSGENDNRNSSSLVDTPVRSSSGSKSASVTSTDRDDGAGAGAGESRKKRKRNKHGNANGGGSRNGGDEGERDWETEWRKQGNGGGKVESWGKEFDREEKAAVKEAAAGGLKIKGASGNGISGHQGPGRGQGNGRGKGTSGQKYHGGYT
ncbi:hypothetical protein IAT40_006241 [Kwoniella sp. CBS 6097]